MTLITSITRPGTYHPEKRMYIEVSLFHDICEAADYQHDEVVRLLSEKNYTHDGEKYWTLQNYIDMANGLTVRHQTMPR